MHDSHQVGTATRQALLGRATQAQRDGVGVGDAADACQQPRVWLYPGDMEAPEGRVPGGVQGEEVG